MQVAKWGNSLAIRLPASVVQILDLKAGDQVNVQVLDSHILEVEKVPDNKALLARLHQYRGRLPKDFKFDRLQAHGED